MQLILSSFRAFWFLFALFCLHPTDANPIKRFKDQLQQVRGQKAEDFLVSKLPSLLENVPQEKIPLMHAGQLLLEQGKDIHYFFWKFVDPAKHPDAENKTIFWFNGGPGCLSLDGALMESGPLRVNEKTEIDYNEGSWHKLADMVFVDQPAGTGFSYGSSFDSNMEEVQEHFLKFMDRYFEMFPEDLVNEIILAGESYAGQYIPYFAAALLRRNEAISNGEKEGPLLNLRGLVIGNGAISGDEQSLSFIPLFLKTGLMDLSHPSWPDLLKLHEECQININKAKSKGEILNGDDACESILTSFLKITRDMLGPRDSQCINMYDFRLRDSFPSCGMNWPPTLPNVYEFLAREDVKNDINIIFPQRWKECNGMVHSILDGGKSTPSVTLLPYILERTEILLFWGDNDIICNYIGGQYMVDNLEWGGQRGYSEEIIEFDWVDNSELSGTYKSERNLSFVKVYNASHMVPFDKPETSRALINLLMKRFAVDELKDKKPKVITKGLIGISDGAADTETETEPSGSSSDNTEAKASTSQIVRVIQLVVVVVLIWVFCATYSQYNSKPTSIIRTETSAPASKKKNVQWAENLENEILEPPQPKDNSFIAKAYNLIRKPDTMGQYNHIASNDIEMREGLLSNDDFIITSDDESSDHRRL